MSKNKKILRERKTGSSERIAPREEPKEPSPQDLSPLFSLKYIQKEYCITCCESREQRDFLKTVKKIEQNSIWKELASENRHGIGYETIDSAKGFNATVPDQFKKYKLLVFRFSENKPMVGFRDGRIFYVLWFDRNFKLYNHGK